MIILYPLLLFMIFLNLFRRVAQLVCEVVPGEKANHAYDDFIHALRALFQFKARN